MKKTVIRKKQVNGGVSSGVDNWEKEAKFIKFHTDADGRRFAVYQVEIRKDTRRCTAK